MKFFGSFFFLFLFGLVSFEFYDLKFFPTTLANSGVVACFVWSVFYVVFSKIKVSGLRYKNLIYLFYVGMFLNLLLMIAIEHVPIYHSFFSLLNYLGFLFYFVLHRIRPSRSIVVRAIFVHAFVVSLLMVFQQLRSETPIFHQLLLHEGFMDNRGTVRVRIPGMAFVVLCAYYCYIQYFVQKRYVFGFLALFLLMIPVLQGFRSITLVLLATIGFGYLKMQLSAHRSVSTNLFLIVAVPAVVAIMISTPYFQEMFFQIKEQIYKDQYLGEHNVRFHAWSYFMGEIKTEWYHYFFGNGLIQRSPAPLGLFSVEMGMFGFYATAGIVPSAALLLMYWKLFRSKCRFLYSYLGLFGLYLLLNSFLFNAEPFRVGITFVYSMVFYLSDLSVLDDKLPV